MTILASLPSRRRLLSGHGTLEVSGYPWLTVGAIQALDLILKPDWRVLELGGGGSTIFFARRVSFVRSIETNQEWFEATGLALDLSGLANVQSTLCSLDGAQVALAKEADSSYDLILIDHQNPDPAARFKVFNRLTLTRVALPKLKPDGWLVIDNYAICRMQHFDTTGWDVWTFDDLEWAGRGTRILRRGSR